jgi:hypothetical protein
MADLPPARVVRGVRALSLASPPRKIPVLAAPATLAFLYYA